MNLENLKIGFIGAGNMGGAMIGALVRSKVPPSNIIVYDKNEARANEIKNTYDIRIAASNPDIILQSDIVVFAVKPQIINQVLKELVSDDFAANFSTKKILVSIAAGIPISRIEGIIYPALTEQNRKRTAIIRVMPNTPALVGAAMSAMCANDHAVDKDIAIVRKLLSFMGDVITCPESLMDAVTAVSGSGPAYCFFLAEAMIHAAVLLGFSKEDARKLTLSTLSGAVRLMAEDGSDPETLRARVTSPGGTTEAAIRVLDQNGVKESIVSAIRAAAERSAQLSKID